MSNWKIETFTKHFTIDKGNVIQKYTTFASVHCTKHESWYGTSRTSVELFLIPSLKGFLSDLLKIVHE
jgi:hypothetical protein